MSRNPKTKDFGHPGSIDVVEEENEIEKELREGLPDYIERRKVFGKEYVRATFADDNLENHQRMQDSHIFCYVVKFFTDNTNKSIGELFDGYPAAELTMRELKEFYEEEK